MPNLPPAVFKKFHYGTVPKGVVAQSIIDAAYAEDNLIRQYEQSVKNCKANAEQMIKGHLKSIERLRKKIKHLRKHPPGKARTMTAMARRKAFVRARTEQIWLRDKLLALRNERANLRPKPNAPTVESKPSNENEADQDRQSVPRPD